MKFVYDIEANGFYEEADTIWCIVTKELDDGHVRTHRSDWAGSIECGIKMLEQAELLICHNEIDYDLRLIKKLYPTFKPNSLILDTYLLSQLLQPDRAGGHSLQSYGERFGRAKPEHEDWSRFTQEMLHRCAEDVEINHLTYTYLMDEAYEPVQGIPYKEIFQ